MNVLGPTHMIQKHHHEAAYLLAVFREGLEVIGRVHAIVLHLEVLRPYAVVLVNRYPPHAIETIAAGKRVMSIYWYQQGNPCIPSHVTAISIEMHLGRSFHQNTYLMAARFLYSSSVGLLAIWFHRSMERLLLPDILRSELAC